MTTQITQAGCCWKNMKLKVCLWRLRCEASLNGGLDTAVALQGGKLTHLLCRMLFLDAHLHRWTHMYSSHGIRCLKSDTHICNNEQCLNSADVASQLSAHTICKSLCHLSTFQQDCLKGDSRTPSLPPSLPSFFLAPSSIPSSVPLSLMTKRLGGLSDRADPCAWADVNSLMVSVMLP